MRRYQLLQAGFYSGIPLRVSLALLCTLASIGLAFALLLGGHGSAHAAPAINELSLGGVDPWGLAFDNRGSVWVAEPACDPAPACGTATTGKIQQVDRASFSIQDTFTEPAGFSSPVFVAVDASGNIWFTEQVTNAIGELIPNFSNPSASTWHHWVVPTAGAVPYDLAFDHNGNLWFTEIVGNNIGEFVPSTQTFVETPTPSANSKPYGIVGPDPTTGAMWFTENNTAVARIASFIPPASGALSTGTIKEYLTKSGSNAATPHLITFDNQGNIWWTEGPDRNIGRLNISQAASGTSNGVTEFTVPYPAPTCPASGYCLMHISGIGVDSAGNVWFDDSQSARIGYYNPGANTFTMLPFLGGSSTSDAHPHDGLVVDSNNNVFVAEEFANKLAKVVTGIPPGQPGSTATPGTPSATSTPPPSTLPPGPVNKTWYFAEGRIGKGFRQYFTIDNPNTVACNVSIQYNYTPDVGTPGNKTVSITVPPATRSTESVNC